MTLERTETQRRAVLQGEVVHLHNTELGKDLVVLRADAYEDIREILQDERDRKAIAQMALGNAAKRLLEDEAS